MREERIHLSDEEVSRASRAIANQLFELPEYQRAQVLLVYAATKHEVDTRAIIERAFADNKVVALPVSSDDGRMEFYQIWDYSDLRPGRFGILEPMQDLAVNPTQGLMLVPGVAFDSHKNRIGQGGGYYDRYLGAHQELTTIGLAYDFQMVDAIDAEEYDQKMDLVITDAQIII